MTHVCVYSITKLDPAFFENIRNYLSEDYTMLVLSPEETTENLKFPSKTFYFTQKNISDVFENEFLCRTEPKMRNALLLLSHALNPEENAIFFSTRVRLENTTISTYERAFWRYKLVNGFCYGATASAPYTMVKFFQMLEAQRNEEELLQFLRGNAETVAREDVSLHGLSGMNFGIAGELKCTSHFSPHDGFSDHFYEFTVRLSNPTMHFMDYSTQREEIPVVYLKPSMNGTSWLIDSYLSFLKYALIENYFYFKLTGCIPKLIENRHSLLKIDKFEIEEIAKAIAIESGLNLFKQAVEYYLEKTQLHEEVAKELKRVPSISTKEFLLSEEQLDREWQVYQEEGRRFYSVFKSLKSEPDKIRRKLKDYLYEV